MNIQWFFKIALLGLVELCLLLCCLSACNEVKNPSTSARVEHSEQDTSFIANVPENFPEDTLSSRDTTRATQEKSKTRSSSKTVLDYFRELSEPYQLPYTLIQNDRLWYATHIPSGKQSQALVDLENGFMELSYLKNDEESESVQVSLLHMNNGKPVLGICIIHVDRDQVAQNCHFVRPENIEQLDWTEYTIPVITAYEFFSENTPGLDSKYFEDAFPILLKLPHYGTELLVQPYLGRRFFYCRDQASNEEQRICTLFDQLERRTFSLNWNSVTGRFE